MTDAERKEPTLVEKLRNNAIPITLRGKLMAEAADALEANADAVEAERERCAAVADAEGCTMAGGTCADAIRADG